MTVMDRPRERGLTHLQRLESESIQIFRESVAESERPVMLYSVGKDSSVLLHLAMKAFYPSKPPFPVLHVDTTWKFKAMYEFRDSILARHGIELIVHRNPASPHRDPAKDGPCPAHVYAKFIDGGEQATRIRVAAAPRG